jgi:hypothetical protein
MTKTGLKCAGQQNVPRPFHCTAKTDRLRQDNSHTRAMTEVRLDGVFDYKTCMKLLIKHRKLYGYNGQSPVVFIPFEFLILGAKSDQGMKVRGLNEAHVKEMMFTIETNGVLANKRQLNKEIIWLHEAF